MEELRRNSNATAAEDKIALAAKAKAEADAQAQAKVGGPACIPILANHALTPCTEVSPGPLQFAQADREKAKSDEEAYKHRANRECLLERLAMDDEDARHRGDYLDMLIKTSLPASASSDATAAGSAHTAMPPISESVPAPSVSGAAGTSTVTVDREKLIVALGAVEKAREAAAALQVPPELLAFLHLGEPVYAGIVRLNDEWGAKAGDLVLERKLLKLISVWLARYQVLAYLRTSNADRGVQTLVSHFAATNTTDATDDATDPPPSARLPTVRLSRPRLRPRRWRRPSKPPRQWRSCRRRRNNPRSSARSHCYLTRPAV